MSERQRISVIPYTRGYRDGTTYIRPSESHAIPFVPIHTDSSDYFERKQDLEKQFGEGLVGTALAYLRHTNGITRYKEGELETATILRMLSVELDSYISKQPKKFREKAYFDFFTAVGELLSH